MTVLSPLRVIAFCLCLSCQKESSAWQGSADIDIRRSKSYCVLFRVVLWIPISFLTYVYFIVPFFETHYTVHIAWNGVALFFAYPTFT